MYVLVEIICICAVKLSYEEHTASGYYNINNVADVEPLDQVSDAIEWLKVNILPSLFIYSNWMTVAECVCLVFRYNVTI